MYRILLSLLGILSFVSNAWCQNNGKLIDSAFKLIDAGNYGKAINIYSGILATDTKNARVYELRGLAYQEIKDYESAFRDFTRSVNADSGYCLGYLRRADLLSQLEYFSEALKDYNRALRYADSVSQRESILVNRAQVKRQMNDYFGAEVDLKEVLAFKPTSIAALVNLGAILQRIGNTKEGIACLEKVIQLDSTFEGGYGNLAFLYSQTGEYQKALEISNKLLTLHPNEGYALNNRGFIKYKLNDLTGALEDINNSIQLFPGNSYAFKNRGLVYIAMKKSKDACADFQKALNLGFTKEYGNEVEDLVKKYCTKPADSVSGL
jgi:tetratricopeptide (TPR) repeat protein